MGRRLARILAVAALAVAGCGGGPAPDPYALLDRAVVVGWQRVQVHIGFTVDVPAQQQDGFPIPATAIRVDPSAIGATIDTQTGQWRAVVSVPLAAVGMDPSTLGPFAPLIQSLDAEVLYDGESLFARSPLLPMLLQGIGGIGGIVGAPIEGDMSGWLRLGSAADLDKLLGAGIPFMTLFGGGGFPGVLTLPGAGDPVALQRFIEEFGIAVVHDGEETANGVDTHHLGATLNLAKLAESRQLAAFTGFGRNELQSIFDASKQVAITADLWTERSTGRLVTFRLDVKTATAPITTFALVVQLADPAPGTSFDAPATFTDVPLVDQLNQSNEGGSGPFDGGATPAPVEPVLPDETEPDSTLAP